MRKDQAIAIGIAAHVESLLSGGRPRMRPGKDRPVATTAGGTVINPRSGEARKFSLEGALTRACWMAAKVHPKATVSRAKQLFLDALWEETRYRDVRLLDHVQYDTREIERVIARIERNLRKEVIA